MKRSDDDVRAQLSAKNLDDVPSPVRIGSPRDASDRKVWRTAKRGQLHPKTNYGVVYRVAFAPRMGTDEEPLADEAGRGAMRFAFIGSGDTGPSEGGWLSVEYPSKPKPGWLLATNTHLRWHFCEDGAPSVVPGVGRPPGPRDAPVHQVQVGDPLRREGFERFTVHDPVRHLMHHFMFPDDPTNPAFLRLVLGPIVARYPDPEGWISNYLARR